MGCGARTTLQWLRSRDDCLVLKLAGLPAFDASMLQPGSTCNQRESSLVPHAVVRCIFNGSVWPTRVTSSSGWWWTRGGGREYINRNDRHQFIVCVHVSTVHTMWGIWDGWVRIMLLMSELRDHTGLDHVAMTSVLRKLDHAIMPALSIDLFQVDEWTTVILNWRGAVYIGRGVYCVRVRKLTSASINMTFNRKCIFAWRINIVESVLLCFCYSFVDMVKFMIHRWCFMTWPQYLMRIVGHSFQSPIISWTARARV